MFSTFLRMWADPRRVIFCSSVTLIFPGILFVCFSMSFLITPSALMTTGTVCVFIHHIFDISISRSLYLERFSATFTDVFWYEGTAIFIMFYY